MPTPTTSDRLGIAVSTTVARPVHDVFTWYADDHATTRHHWDPDRHVVPTDSAPVDVGTEFNYETTDGDTGTMTVTEYDPEYAFALTIEDGDTTVTERTTFVANNPYWTQLLISTYRDPTLDRATVETTLRERGRRLATVLEATLPA